MEKLKAENQKLQSQLVRHYLLVQENQAFRDQYAKSEATAKSLLPATVLSHRDSDKLLIDQGSANGVKNGQAVVLNDQLVGVIIAVTPHTATVRLVISKDFPLPRKQ